MAFIPFTRAICCFFESTRPFSRVPVIIMHHHASSSGRANATIVCYVQELRKRRGTHTALCSVGEPHVLRPWQLARVYGERGQLRNGRGKLRQTLR